MGSWSGYWWPSRGFTSRGTFWDCCCLFPTSCGELLLTHTYTGDPPTPAGSFASVSCDGGWGWWLLLHFSESCFTEDFVCNLQDWSLRFQQSCGNLVIRSHWPSRSDSLGIPVPLLDPQVGSLTWGLEPSLQWENFFGIIFLQFLGCPSSGVVIWFYHDCAPPTISLQLCPKTKKILWSIFFWWVPVSFCWGLCNS